MKKLLLAILLAVPFLGNAQGPGGIGLPAIWLKGDDGVTPATNGSAITGWQNKGSIAFTLLPSFVSPAITNPTFSNATDRSGVTFASGQTMSFDQVGSELSSILGDGINTLKYDVFIVATGNSSGALIYLGPNTPGTTSTALDHIGFGKRAVYYSQSAPASTFADAEIGYYGRTILTNNVKEAYTPNVPINGIPSELTISNIISNPYDPYTDLNSLLFSINGIGNTKQNDGVTASPGGQDYFGKQQDYVAGSQSNRYNTLNVTKVQLGGLYHDISGLKRPFAGTYYEIIIYPRRLTTTERQKVYSYLATKYRIYLAHDQAAYAGTAILGNGTGNGETVNNGTYFASDGSIIFKRDGFTYSNNQDYNGNTVTGFPKDTFYPLSTSNTNDNFQLFGRDDASGLNTWVTGNSSGAYFEKSPKSQMPGDKQFMTMTSNGATMASYSTTNDANTPFPIGANIEGRLARTWKITTTGYNDSFNMNPNVTAAIVSNNGFTNANIVLLISKDPTFPANKTAAISGFTGITPSSGFLSKTTKVSDILGPVGAGEYKVFYATIAKTNGTTGLPVTLPVELASFTAKANSSSVSLNWNTTSEKNASHFNITRSVDGANFSIIGKVEAAGNTYTERNYKFTDFSPLKGTNYYQLQQVDLDGTQNPSGIVSAKIAVPTTALTLQEIGATDISLGIYVPKAIKGKIEATNLMGQKIADQSVNLSEGNNRISVTTGANKGLLILTLTTTEGTISKKVVK
jgi:hypothetical protein